jgi:type II secretory pathway predicted ATPase ExeA
MYLEYFQLREKPFRIAPDPAYFFFSAIHREALSALSRGIDDRCGLLMLIGEVGTGKTTLCRLVQERRGCTSIYLTNPFLNVGELVEAVHRQLGIPIGSGAPADRLDQIREHLIHQHRSGKTVVLFIDEAHRLALPLLEQVLVLSNLQRPNAQLLQIVLVGQSELLELLNHPQLASLNQRIGVRYHLKGMDRDDSTRYVSHRLRRAGCPIDPLVSPGALDAVWKASGGRPRLINLLCERALVETYRRGKKRVGRREVGAVVGDPLHRTLFGTRLRRLGLRPALSPVMVGVSLASALMLTLGYVWTTAAPARWLGALFPERVTFARRPIPLLPTAGTEEGKAMRVQVARRPISAPARGDRVWDDGETQRPQAERQAPSLGEGGGDSAKGAEKRYAHHGPWREGGDDAVGMLTVAKVQRADDGAVVLDPIRQQATDLRASPAPGLLPPFTLSAIAWDKDAKRRFVVLNERILHEGEFLGEAQVLRIHPDRVVLLHHNDEIIERLHTRESER